MKQKYPDHSWFKHNPWQAWQSTGRNSPDRKEGEGWVWHCVRCGARFPKSGQEPPLFHELLRIGMTLNCDLSLISRIMES